MRIVPPINICSECLSSNVGLFNTKLLTMLIVLKRLERWRTEIRIQSLKQPNNISNIDDFIL